MDEYCKEMKKVNCKLNLNNLIEQDKNKIESAKSENKASRAVSVDISLSAAKSASIFESVTTQASVHLKCTLACKGNAFY